MKKLLIPFLSALLFAACTQNPTTEKDATAIDSSSAYTVV